MWQKSKRSCNNSIKNNDLLKTNLQTEKRLNA